MRRKHNSQSCPFRSYKCAICKFLKKDDKIAETHLSLMCNELIKDRSLFKKVMMLNDATKFRSNKLLRFSEEPRVEDESTFSDEELMEAHQDLSLKVESTLPGTTEHKDPLDEITTTPMTSKDYDDFVRSLQDAETLPEESNDYGSSLNFVESYLRIAEDTNTEGDNNSNETPEDELLNSL